MSTYSKSGWKGYYGSATGPFQNSGSKTVTGPVLQTFASDMADSMVFNDSYFDVDTYSFDAYDFLNQPLPYGWTSTGTGGGSLGGGSSSSTAQGFAQLNTLTGVGYWSLYRGLFFPVSMAYDFRTRLAVGALSDGTNTYTLRAGFGTGNTQWTTAGAEFTDGCFFRYTHSVNGAKWQAVTRSGGVETATDTGVTTSTTYAVFRVAINQAATSVSFYINNALVATNTTNIPSSSASLYQGWKIDKTAGGVSNTLNVDWYSSLMAKSSAR